jgi:hypothetical protein
MQDVKKNILYISGLVSTGILTLGHNLRNTSLCPLE